MKQFVEEYLKHLSFDFDSFEKAKCELYYQGCYIKFDRLSLCYYSHSFTPKMWSEFIRLLQGNLPFKSEEEKRREEFVVLFSYAKFHKDYVFATIEKQIRPDFKVILEGKEIGVEITELTTPKDKIMERILNDNYGSNPKVENIREMAITKHGSKAKDYEYYDINGTFAISSRTFVIDNRIEYYADRIMQKYEKYKDILSEFHKFVILCNLTDPVICENDEVEKIIDLFVPYEQCHNLVLAILYTDKNNRLKLCEKSFSNES